MAGGLVQFVVLLAFVCHSSALLSCSYHSSTGDYYDLSPLSYASGAYEFFGRSIGPAKWAFNLCNQVNSSCNADGMASMCAEGWATDRVTNEPYGYLWTQRMQDYEDGEGVTVKYTGAMCKGNAMVSTVRVDAVCDYSEDATASMISTLAQSVENCFVHFQILSKYACATQSNIVRNPTYNPMCSINPSHYEYALTSSGNSTGQYAQTLEAFIQPLYTSVKSAPPRSGMLMSAQVAANTTVAIYINNQQAVEVVVYGLTESISAFTSKNLFSVNMWSHLAVIVNPQYEVSVYVNGEIQPVIIVPLYSNLVFKNGFTIGDSSNMKKSFNGYLTKVATWSRVLAIEEIQQHAVSYNFCDTTGLQFFFRFDECLGSQYSNQGSAAGAVILCPQGCHAHDIWPALDRETACNVFK